jgi:Tfp pilus assembly pilus retraction ATPase PilT
MNAEEKFTKSLQKLINLEGSDIHLREDRPAYLRSKKQVEPNIEVEPTLNDYLSKKDLVIIKATEYLKKEIKTKNN